MSLETATFVADLDPSNPGPTDLKSQGDDHLRLIKQVLQNTFPGANGPVGSGQKTAVKSANYSILTTDDQTTFLCNTSSGPFTLTLPTLPPTTTSWTIRVQKTTSDANPVFIQPSSGTIGGFSKIRRSVENLMTNVFWNGSSFAPSRPFGAPIGSCLEFYGSTLPNGFLWPDGATFTATDYVELNTVLLGNIKPDRRGRVAVARDNIGGTAANRVTSAGSGINGVGLGASGGAENVTLDATMIPSHTHPVTEPNSGQGHRHGTKLDLVGSGAIPGGAVGQSVSVASQTEFAPSGITIGASPGGGQFHNNMPPTLVANFILVAE